MKITDIRIKKMDTAGRLRAVVSVTFDDAFVVHDIKIIEGPERLFLAMPSRRLVDGRYSDIAHPISSTMRELLEKEIMARYLEQDDYSSQSPASQDEHDSSHTPQPGQYTESEAW